MPRITRSRIAPALLACVALCCAPAAQAEKADREKNIEFHRILAHMTGNPIMVVVVGGVLDVLRQFIHSIGEYPNRHVLPSRKRFIAHLEAGDADAAVAEMQASLMKLQKTYLSRLEK